MTRGSVQPNDINSPWRKLYCFPPVYFTIDRTAAHRSSPYNQAAIHEDCIRLVEHLLPGDALRLSRACHCPGTEKHHESAELVSTPNALPVLLFRTGRCNCFLPICPDRASRTTIGQSALRKHKDENQSQYDGSCIPANYRQHYNDKCALENWYSACVHDEQRRVHPFRQTRRCDRGDLHREVHGE